MAITLDSLGRTTWKVAEILRFPNVPKQTWVKASFTALCLKCSKEANLLNHASEEVCMVILCPGCHHKEKINGKTLIEVATDDYQRRREKSGKEWIIVDIEDRVNFLSDRQRAALFTFTLPALQHVAQEIQDHPEDAHRIIARRQ
jgi:DNA-directed RNA polymerase subunit RPC12/RpoP